MAERETDPPDGTIADEGGLRALAHPLRWALIEALSVEGTATAARCAQLVGESHASCSFHLRQLARFGIVEQAPTESRRDRPWRLVSKRQDWSSAPSGDAARDRAAHDLSQVFVNRETERIRRWVRDEDAAPGQWRRAAFRSGLLTWLTPAELDELSDRVVALIESYLGRVEHPGQRPPGARPVRFFAAGYPVLELDPDGMDDPDGTDVGPA